MGKAAARRARGSSPGVFHKPGWHPGPRWFAAVWVALASLPGCGPETPHHPPLPSATAQAGPAAAAQPEPSDGTASGGAARVVAIGDLHGDIGAGRRALRVAGLIDPRERWSGGQTMLIQLGDLLDRGDTERELMDLFERLVEEAAAVGGEVQLLLGNHEVMNVAGDLRYVTPGGFTQFEDAPAHPTHESRLRRAPTVAYGRLRAFLPGGPMALRLARYQLFALEAGSVFVHGGIVPEHADRSRLEAAQTTVQAWIRGEAPPPMEFVMAPDSVVWTREFSAEPDEDQCARARRSLTALGVERMIVAHTVHREGIQRYCDGAVFVIDTGMSAHYGGPVQVLELTSAGVRILPPTVP